MITLLKDRSDKIESGSPVHCAWCEATIRNFEDFLRMEFNISEYSEKYGHRVIFLHRHCSGLFINRLKMYYTWAKNISKNKEEPT